MYDQSLLVHHHSPSQRIASSMFSDPSGMRHNVMVFDDGAHYLRCRDRPSEC